MKIFLLIMYTVLLLANPVYVQADSLSEQESVKLLTQKVKSNRLYPWANFDCLAFIVEDKTNTSIDIAVREIHDGKCPGDPGVSPVVDRFRVMRSTKTILWFDFVTGKYARFAQAKSRRQDNNSKKSPPAIPAH